MSYEELLNTLNSKQFMESRTPETPYFALRAVVELHKPVLETFLYGLELDPPEVTGRYECENCAVLYPCPTIQAIERELG